MGFAAGRNRKSEEECSPKGLQAGENELSHSKNLFRNEKKRRETSAHLVDEP